MRQRAMYRTSTGLILVHHEERKGERPAHIVALIGDAPQPKTLYMGFDGDEARRIYQETREHYAARERNAAQEAEEERIRMSGA